MRIAVIGATGMLGRDVLDVLVDRSRTGFTAHDVVGFRHAELDIADDEAVLVGLQGFDAIVNATGYTRVDDAETDEAAAYAVNADGPANLAAVARATGARLVHVSTDYVFDGHASAPYPEDHPRDPINAYGRTKAAGEVRALSIHPSGTLILRTAWLYGQHGPSMPRTMLRLAGERDTVSVVTDQLGQPTWTRDLADRIVQALEQGVPAGIYHATNAGQTTWYDLTREVYRLSGLDPERVRPTDSTAFVRPAPRPAYSVLSHAGWAKVGLPPMRPWQTALAEAVAVGAFAG